MIFHFILLYSYLSKSRSKTKIHIFIYLNEFNVFIIYIYIYYLFVRNSQYKSATVSIGPQESDIAGKHQKTMKIEIKKNT